MALHLGHCQPQQRVLHGLVRQLEGAALYGKHLEAARPIPLRHHQAVEPKALRRHRRPQHPLHPLPVQAMALLETGRLVQHQPPRQIRLHHDQNPAQIEHQP